MWLHPKEGDDSQAVLSACLRFLRKKPSVLFGVLSLWATSKKHQLQKKNVKNDTTTYQFIDMLHRVCGMKVLSKIFLNVL